VTERAELHSQQRAARLFENLLVKLETNLTRQAGGLIMLTLACTPEVIEALRHERFHHPHPHVLMKDGEALCEKPGTAGGTHPAVMCDRQSDILSLPPSVPHRRACATPRGPCRVSGEGPTSVSRASGSLLGRASTGDGRRSLGPNGRADRQQRWCGIPLIIA